MDPEKSSNLTLPPGTNKEYASGVTTPDLIDDEKEHGKSYDQSLQEQEQKPATPDDAPVEEYPTGKQLIPVLLALICSVFLIALDMTIVGTAIPKITDEFGGLNMVSWYGSGTFNLVLDTPEALRGAIGICLADPNRAKCFRSILFAVPRSSNRSLLIKLSLFHDLWRLSTGGREVLQILSAKSFVSGIHCRLHARQSHLWCCSELYYLCRRPCVRWSRS